MKKKMENDSELFFWVKSGEVKGENRIHSIHQKHSKAPSQRVTIKKPKIGMDAARTGLKPGWIRATIIVREDNLKKIKALAYWERKEIKQIVDEALNSHFGGREINPIPEKT